MIIEKNIPKPDHRNAGRKRWPFMDMDVDDSVYFEPAENGGNIKGVIDASHNYGAYTKKKFVSRKQPCGGVRIWRVE